MRGWQMPYLGLQDLPQEFSEFELQAFFSLSRAERDLISRRRSELLKLGLALHIGFLRMSGRPLNSVRTVPAVRPRTTQSAAGAAALGRPSTRPR